MKHFELKGQVRETGNKAVIKALRGQGLVPCNLYGNGVDNILDEGKKYTAVVHELQFHPVEDVCLHVDFLAVNEEKPIAIKVPLNITGHAAGVQAGGKFVKNQRELRISALMKNLPDQLDVDITELGIGQNIVAGDLHYDNVTILSPKSTIICGVKATRQSAQPR